MYDISGTKIEPKALENASFPYHNIFHSSNESSLFIICSAGLPQKKKKKNAICGEALERR